jgi:Domain of Unknown Function (DUF1080)
MFLRFIGSAVAAIVISGMAHAETRVLSFDQDAVGAPPPGFVFSHAKSRGKPGTWSILADDPERKNVLAQTGTDSVDARYPVAVVDALSVADVDLSVKYKPVSGSGDMAAGLVWRYRDADNYYIVRANALEDNVVLYKVEAGRRSDLALKGKGKTYGAKSLTPKGKWSTLRVVAEGNVFTVYNNGVELYQVEDQTFKAAGKVGVWTKADSVTYFDDLTIVTK